MKTLKTLIPTIIVLAILASAVAMWYDILKIHASIETGSVDVEFGDVWCEETPEAEGKDVGSCSVELKEIEGEGPDDNDLDLNITISNAYPGYEFEVCAEVKNVGTIPVKGPYLVSASPPGLPNWIEVVEHNISVVQIEPGGSYTFCATFTILQNAPEGETLTGQVLVRFIQWNEAPPTTTTTPE